jgi:hypothetical protein
MSSSRAAVSPRLIKRISLTSSASSDKPAGIESVPDIQQNVCARAKGYKPVALCSKVFKYFLQRVASSFLLQGSIRPCMLHREVFALRADESFAYSKKSQANRGKG